MASLCPFLPRECSGLLEVKSLACPPPRRAGFRLLPGPRVRGRPAPLQRTRPLGVGWVPAKPAAPGKAPQAHVPAACVRETPAARSVRGSTASTSPALRRASGQLWPPPAAGFPTRGRGGARDRHSLLFRVGRAPGGPGRGRLWAAIPDVRISALFLAASPDGRAQRCSLAGPWGRRRHSPLFFLPLRLTLVTCAGHPLRTGTQPRPRAEGDPAYTEARRRETSGSRALEARSSRPRCGLVQRVLLSREGLLVRCVPGVPMAPRLHHRVPTPPSPAPWDPLLRVHFNPRSSLTFEPNTPSTSCRDRARRPRGPSGRQGPRDVGGGPWGGRRSCPGLECGCRGARSLSVPPALGSPPQGTGFRLSIGTFSSANRL